MESKRGATGIDPLHICYWRQPYRFCWQKDHEPAFHTTGLALGYYLYTSYNYYLAYGCVACQFSFWSIPLLFTIYPKDRGKDGVGEVGGRKS